MIITSFHFFLHFYANYNTLLVVSTLWVAQLKASWMQEAGTLNSLHPDLWQTFGTVSSKDDSQEQEENASRGQKKEAAGAGVN